MDRKTEEIIDIFPGLKNDADFKVTSPKDAEYNCVAWAAERKDVWMWPISPKGDQFFWPDNFEKSLNVEAFITAFENIGFTICDKEDSEPGYIKIVIYAIDGKVTHMARQKEDGLWTSKLGWWEDIQHSTPHSLEGNFYGKVHCYMKKK